MDRMNDSDIGLLLAFDADGEFVRGFEAGRLWTQLQDESEHEGLVGQPLHRVNTEMMMRMGEALDLSISARTEDETWVVITAIESVVAA